MALSQSHLFIGVDIGTTFSGVAFGLSKGGKIPRAIDVVSSWDSPIDQNRYRSKVPTRIQYAPQRRKDGIISGWTISGWGYEIPMGDGNITVEWFKLALLKKKDVPPYLKDSPYLQRARQSLKVLEKDAVDVLADYRKSSSVSLRAVKIGRDNVQHAVRELFHHALKRFKSSLIKKYVDSFPFHVRFTVPAIWPQYYRDRMLKAAKLAGILEPRPCGSTTSDFMTEPEAAGLVTIQNDLHHLKLEKDDTITVIDCGGGTVDLISYVVTQPNPLRLGESIGGEGALCGAIFLDEAFITLLREDIFADKLQGVDSSDRYFVKDLNNGWEQLIKSSFDGHNGPWEFEYRADPRLINADQIRDCWTRSVEPKIRQLISNQVTRIHELTKQKPQLVILAGGFGQAPYIKKLVEEVVGAGPNGPDILQEDSGRSWSCICRGAVLSASQDLGMNYQDDQIRVTSRKARHSYGWFTNKYFDGTVHDESEKIFDTNRQADMVSKRIDWFLHRDEDVDACASMLEYDRWYTDGLTGYRLIQASVYRTTDPDPKDKFDPDTMEEVGKVHVRLPMPIEQLPKRKKNGCSRDRRYFGYYWKLEVSGAAIRMEAFSGKEKVGSATLDTDEDQFDSVLANLEGVPVEDEDQLDNGSVEIEDDSIDSDNDETSFDADSEYKDDESMEVD